MLSKAPIGGAGEASVTIDVVLLHPARGVALLEAPPHWTLDAPARLRRRLAQARFAAIYPGTLPVLHARLQREALPSLPELLAKGFAAQPPLDLPGGDAWMAAVRRALLAPADVPGAGAGSWQRGRLIGGAGLVLASVLGGAILAQQPRALPPSEQAAPPGLLERLTSGVVVPAEAAGALPLVEAERPPAPPPMSNEASMEDARAAEFADASPPAAPPSPPIAPDLLVTPTMPPLSAAPPAIAAPSELEPHLTVQPAAVREAAAPLARPASEPMSQPPAAPVVAKPTEPAPARRPPAAPAAIAALLRRGDALIALGDVSGARRFYERAAEAGSAPGARAAGRTHDPAVLADLGARGIRPDPGAAADWYRRAETLAAQERP